MSEKQTFVIVGGGLAGAKAAQTLRDEGFEGRLVLFAAEDDRPYERPPLSKDYLRGEAEREKAYVHPPPFYDEHEIELRTGTQVTGLDLAGREVLVGDGERLRYDALLLATGAEPRRLTLPGAELPGVHYLRSFPDCDALRAVLAPGIRVVVIGAGWIASEVAASVRQLGAQVTMVAPDAVPLERVLGPEVGAIYRDLHADHGVELVLGTGVRLLVGRGAVSGVRINSGRLIECDLVVIGIGAVPRTQLAEAAGLPVQDGIVVDAQLRAGATGVFAAGDVARAHHPLLDAEIRVEHWANALNQGPVAALNMLGRDVAYDRIPYFFSDQYDVGMEYSGYAPHWDEVVFRGDVAGREFIAFWLADRRIVAGMNVNVWDVNEQVQQLIRAGRRVDHGRLTDPDTPLEELLPAGCE